VEEVVVALGPLLPDQVERLLGRHDENSVGGVGEDQHSLHGHSDVVPAASVGLEGYVLWGSIVRGRVVELPDVGPVPFALRLVPVNQQVIHIGLGH